MSRFLYSALLTILLPFLLLRLVLKGRKAPAYRQRWRERLGLCPLTNDKTFGSKTTLWFHTVSVGETIAAAPLIEACLASHKVDAVLVTTMTPTGSDRVKALFGDRVEHVYCPWDIPFAVKAFLSHWKPTLAVMMETELWPNTVAECRKQGISVVLANGRLSEQSAKGYQKLRRLVEPMLQSFTRLLVQNEQDAARFLEIGADEDQLVVVGSVKFDIQVSDDQRKKATDLKKQFLNRRVWIAASTHDGEDEQILEAHAAVLEESPDAVLLLVPRHPERFESVFSLAAKRFDTIMRSDIQAFSPKTQVVVGDTMGEMMVLFGASDIAVVAGSFIPHGGHNVLEPAAWSMPVLSGPYVHNFQAICDDMVQSGALHITTNVTALANEIGALLKNDKAYKEAGQSAIAFLNSRRGSLACQRDEILGLIN